MKKMMSVLLVCCMLTGVLAGCGDKGDGGNASAVGKGVASDTSNSGGFDKVEPASGPNSIEDSVSSIAESASGVIKDGVDAASDVIDEAFTVSDESSSDTLDAEGNPAVDGDIVDPEEDNTEPATVFYNKSGVVYHKYQSCPQLLKGSDITEGTMDEADAAGKKERCPICYSKDGEASSGEGSIGDNSVVKDK